MKKVKLLTITLIIVLVAMVAFVGVYVQKQNRMEDKVRDYSYSMDLKGTRNVTLKVSQENKTIIKDSNGNEVADGEDLTDEEISQNGYTKEEIPYNSEEVLNVENYKKSKEILEKRLKAMNVQNYTIKVNEQTGDIILELTENENTDSIISNIGTVGKFEIVDTQTNEVLITNKDIKLANVMYGSGSSTGTTSSGTTVYLNIEFTKEGKQKLEEISNKYIKSEDTGADENTTENETSENTTDETKNEKTITMKIDDEEIMSTSFDEPIRTGKLQLSVGRATTDQDTLQDSIAQASSMATVLDTGNLPLKYEVDGNEYVLSDITENQLQIVQYAIIGIVAIGLIVLIIRYKSNGLLGAISYVGLVALFVLIIRYTNVVLSIEGIFAIAITLLLNYIFVNKLLAKLKQSEVKKENIKQAIKETYKEFFIKIIPICIMVITFCFIKWIPISSFGMVMFWGIALIAIYHISVTNSLLRIKASK